MGFLIGDRFVLTCMHVVLDSLGKERNCQELPNEEVVIDFPGLLPIRQTALATMFSGFQCFGNSEKRDVALLKLKEKDKLILTHAPLLSINSNSNLPGISCSYFVCKNETYYGWGDGVISETVVLGRVQINQMLSGSGKLVEHGFSGTPVWANHMNGVIGMLDQVVPEKGMATFIPNSVLMDCLPAEIQMEVVPAYIQRLRVPKLPLDYIKRDGLIDKINNLLALPRNNSEGNLIVVHGPSGSGKSNTVLDVFYNYRQVKHWFDCKMIYQKADMFEKLFNLDESHLVVVDNLVMGHRLYKEGWLKELKCNIIVITCEDAVADGMCFQFYKNAQCKQLIKSTGFDLAESRYYFRIGLPDSLTSDEDIASLHQITHGMPILMQFLKSVIIEERSIIEAENRFSLFSKKESLKKYLIKNELSIAEVKGLLVDKWLEKLAETSRMVVGILSFIPIVGMSSEALLHTCKLAETDLQEAINTLCNAGFIQIHFKGLSQKDNLIIIHDLVKELVLENNKLDNPVFLDNYIAYLDASYNFNISSDTDLISKIDILMLQMKRLFQKRRAEKITRDGFFKEMDQINNAINKYIPLDTGNSVTSEWIGKLLENVIPSADCSLLISLGQSIHNFKANGIMGSAIWQGAYNYDSWGRACCIHAAVSHWKRLGGDYLLEGKRQLDSWIHDYLYNPTRFSENKGKNKYYDNQIDLDIATALGGLCHLGFEDAAITYLDSAEFNKYHPCSVASDLVVILYLASHNDIENVRRKKAQELIDSHFSRISNSSVQFLADEFLETRNYKMPAVLGQQKILTAKAFGATIACAAYSQAFRQYAYDNGDISSMIGGIIPNRL